MSLLLYVSNAFWASPILANTTVAVPVDFPAALYWSWQDLVGPTVVANKSYKYANKLISQVETRDVKPLQTLT
jgi:hypothetical protein